ncbi:MAG: hypothetical protein ACKVOO_10550 [Burkholderiaceae bacterium]
MFPREPLRTRTLFLLPFMVLAAVMLAACQPALNWRQVPSEHAPLTMLLPCKPDRASRSVTLAGQDLQLHMRGCEVAGVTFAVMVAQLPQPAQAGAVLAHWRAATLQNMQAAAAIDTVFVPVGAIDLPQSLRTHAAGVRKLAAAPVAVQAQAVWFSNASHVFHAVVYAEQIQPEVTERFFPGLQLQR